MGVFLLAGEHLCKTCLPTTAGRDNDFLTAVPPAAVLASPGLPAGSISAMSDDRPALIVSACLLGTACNHEGGHSRRAAVEALAATHRLFPICPEVCGGLSTPRIAAEIQGERVVNRDGVDVTDAYERGAQAAVGLAAAVGAQRAVLKARSPSCGSRQIYDGSFSRTLRAGEGVTAAALLAVGVNVVSEEDLDSLD
jgi:uncharacterized protein YbbK (DUF523 family)